MNRWAIVVLVLATLALGAAKCEGGAGDTPKSHPTAGQKQQREVPADPNINNPGPVQADPNAHDPDPGQAQFSATWWSETKDLPQIRYRLSATGPEVPVTNLRADHRPKGGYLGIWDLDINVKSGQTISFVMYGTVSFTSADCVIIHHGQFHSRQQNRRNCASSYTIP